MLVTAILSDMCKTVILEEMNRTRCQGFNVYDDKEFYALHYSAVSYAFSVNNSEARDIFESFENATLAHMSNALSSDYKIEVDSNAAYGLLAEIYCPKVYHSCGEKF